MDGKKTHKFHFVCFTAVMILLLGGCSLYMYLTPDRIYSPQERRMLSKRPKLTEQRVLKGKFQRDYETYLSEQFPGRTYWVSLETKLTRMLGEKDAKGVYFGSDGYLLEQYKEQDFDWGKVEGQLGQVADFLDAYPQAKVMFVPAKSSVLSGKLPLFAEESGEGRFFGLVAEKDFGSQQIVVSDVLKAHDSEYIYYRTDHHWTTLGAYYAYEKWAQDMGFTAVPQEEFNIRDVSNTFFGTTYAKVRTGGEADTISLYEAKEAPEYEIDYNLGEFQSGSFYDESKLEGDDPYSVFFGGNQALVDIRAVTPDGAGKTLMIIKDSFGNCFAPLAANHYERTVVVDLRHVNIPIGNLLSVYPADDILILYNSIQFMEDKEISKLK